MTGLQVGISAGLRAFTDPDSQERDRTIEEKRTQYSMRWMYYRSLMFSNRDGGNWTVYLAQRELYKRTRLLYNPVPQVVDFYVDNVWRPADDPEFESLVTPVTDRTDDKLKAAIGQLDQWGNFASEAQKIKRYAASCGDVLLEGIDDMYRQKIVHRNVWPGYVTHLELNNTGDVQAYTIEYPVYDAATATNYIYRKEVTKESFRYFRDDKPFTPSFARAPEEENPYGFCFAVWIKHGDDGSDHGLPAFHDYDKVDNVNGLASHLDDYIHKGIESPKLISVDDEVVPLVGARTIEGTKRIEPQDPRLNWVVFKSKAGASVHDLAGDLRLAESHPYLQEQLASFTDDYPELQARSIIKENSQLSGAALERLLTPAQNRLDGAQAGYNQQLIKFRQMGIAVAGYRANNGGWNMRTQQQDIFRPFGLESYNAGTLDFNLKRSKLIGNTEEEIEKVRGIRLENANKALGLVDQAERLRIAGYSEDKIKEIQDAIANEVEPATEPPMLNPPQPDPNADGQQQ